MKIGEREFLLIAEVKPISPFGFRADKSWEELFVVAQAVGDMLSIHTDLRWGGSLGRIREARKKTSKPILAKGIHSTDQEIRDALSAGANVVLVVGRVPDESLLTQVFIEPLSLDELNFIPDGTRVVWNSRDLATGKKKKETFKDARKIWEGWLCQASNIRTVADIETGADAVLVGEHLEKFLASY